MKLRSNSIKDVSDYIRKELKNRYSQEEIKSLINILLSHYCGLSSAHIIAYPEQTINESELLEIYYATKDLRKYRPIQYILGRVDFLNLSLKVNQHVLIPRPETEELCQNIINQHKNQNPKIIDLCTGSGCIALAMKKNIPHSEVFALDISQEALQVAKQNALDLGLQVNLILADLLEDKEIFPDSDQKFDIIISNPPYVLESEKALIKNNVLDYEPSLALFVKDENPLVFYEKIVVFAEKYLKAGGEIYLECNEKLCKETLALFPENKYIGEVIKDIFDKERFIILKKIH